MEYLHRVVTITTTTGVPKQNSVPSIQAPGDQEDSDNSNKGDNNDNVRHTTGHIGPIVLAITRWVMLIRANSALETEGLGTMLLQFLLKLFLITDIV